MQVVISYRNENAMRELNGMRPLGVVAFVRGKLCAAPPDEGGGPDDEVEGSELATFHAAFGGLTNAKQQVKKSTTLASDCGMLLQEILKVAAAFPAACVLHPAWHRASADHRTHARSFVWCGANRRWLCCTTHCSTASWATAHERTSSTPATRP